MATRRLRVYRLAEKLRAVKRMARRECGMTALSRELGVPLRVLYQWRSVAHQEGMEGLKRQPGRPRRGMPGPDLRASTDIAAWQQKVGEQALVIDFLQRACKRVEALRPPSTGVGGTASTARSKR